MFWWVVCRSAERCRGPKGAATVTASLSPSARSQVPITSINARCCVYEHPATFLSPARITINSGSSKRRNKESDFHCKFLSPLSNKYVRYPVNVYLVEEVETTRHYTCTRCWDRQRQRFARLFTHEKVRTGGVTARCETYVSFIARNDLTH